MTVEYLIEPLGQQHDRAAFVCGSEPLDRYLRHQASQDVRRHLAAVFVLQRVNSPIVLGYYTLSMNAIEPTSLPADLIKRLPRYPILPAALIGRLAVHQHYQGQRHGERLLLDALYRCLRISAEMATMAVLVDAKDAQAHRFYERYGFQRFTDRENRLFLPMKTIERLFGEEA
jgi:GNAT superfamily N-acetyltransferase